MLKSEEKTLILKFFSLFLWLVSLFGPAFAHSLDSVEYFKKSLTRLQEVQKPLSQCKVQNRCPEILFELQKEDFQTKLGMLESRAMACVSPVSQSQGPKVYSQFSDSKDLLNHFAKQRFPELGEINESQIRACASSDDSSDRYRVTKFYYMMKRFNDGSNRVLEELAGIQSLLGDQDDLPCSNLTALPQVQAHCEELKKCPRETDNLAKVSLESEKIEPLYKTIVADIENLKKTCLQNSKDVHSLEKEIEKNSKAEKCVPYFSEHHPNQETCVTYTKQNLEQVRNCEKNLEGLQLAEMSYASQFPWLRSPKFHELRKKKPSSEAIKQFSLENRAALKDQFNQFLESASCLNGLNEKSKSCDKTTIRKALSKTPDLPVVFGKDSKLNASTLYLSSQSCVEDGVADQHRTSEILTSLGRDAILTVATMGAGSLISAGRAALAVEASSAAKNSFHVSRIGAATGKAVILGTDGYYFSESALQAFKSCQENLSQIKSPSGKLQCPSYQSGSSIAQKKYSNCLADTALAGMSALPFAPLAIQKLKNLKSSGANEKIESGTSAYRARENHSVDRRLPGPKESNRSIQKLSEHKIPGTTDGLKVYSNRSGNNESFLTYEYAVNVPGKGLMKKSAELPVDPLTGAIDGNNPSGRKFLELLVEENRGHAHVAFLDVGNLGFVNREFKKGREAGDLYLKKVAEAIRSVDQEKVSIIKLGGDEFGIVILEKDPEKAQKILQSISNKIYSKDVHEIFRDEKIERARAFRESTEPLEVKEAQFKKDFVPYSRESASIGSTQIGAADTVETVLNRAESQATRSKIEAKVRMNQDASKYGGPKPDPNGKTDQRYIPLVGAPIPAPKSTAENAKRPRLQENLTSVKEFREREVGRFDKFSLAEYVDETGERSFKLEKYFTNAKGEREYLTHDVALNAKTGFIDANTANGKEILSAISNEKAKTGVIWIDASHLGEVNYFAKGTKAGDELLEAVGSSVKEVLRKENIGFKLKGSEFLIEVGQADPKVLQSIQKRIETSVQQNPLAQKVFAEQRWYLEAELKKNPNSSEIRQKLERLTKLKPEVTTAATVSNSGDNLESILSRTQGLHKKP